MKKINIIDIGVVLIFILFIVGLGVRFSGTTTKTPVNNNVEVEYTVMVEGVRDYTVEALKKSNVLTEQKTGAVIGEIVSIEAKAYADEVKGDDGKLYLAEVPDRYLCTLVLKSPVQKMNDRYFATDTTEIAAGKDFKLATKYAQTTATIIRVSEN